MRLMRVLIALLLVFALQRVAYGVSPNGTTCTAPNVCNPAIVSVDGKWTWGPSAGSGNYQTWLNNAYVPGGGAGVLYQIANLGHLYVKNSAGQWYTWKNSAWAITSDPNGRSTGKTVSQVHNAPGWKPNTSYQQGARVNNGPGWNGTSFVPYQTLRAYQVTNGPCTSGNTGGPTVGSGIVTEGGCNWRYLSDTDYVTITGWGHDGPAWTGKSYGFMDQVAAPNASGILTIYRNENASGCPAPPDSDWTHYPNGCGYGTPGNCNSTVAPPNNPAGDNCQWNPRGPITYTSGKSFIPKQVAGNSGWIVRQYKHDYEADLWNDLPYVMGQNGEASTSMDAALLHDHMDMFWQGVIHGLMLVYSDGNCGEDQNYFNIPTQCSLIITAAPGESFADKLAASPTLPLRYDPSYGVSIVGTIHSNDTVTTLRRLQISNPYDWAFRFENMSGSIENSIIEVGTPTTSVKQPWQTTAYLSVSNSLIIAHGPNAMGYRTHYVGTLAHSTIVNPEGNGGICVGSENNYFVAQGQFLNQTVCSGFAHLNGAFANQVSAFISYNADPANAGAPIDNYTTSPYENANGAVPSVPGYSSGNDPATYAEYPVNGTNYGINPSTLFVGRNDYRVNPSGPLRGAGANFGLVNRCPIGKSGLGGYPIPCPVNLDTPDIVGSARPATGSDVGAWQTPGGSRRPPPSR